MVLIITERWPESITVYGKFDITDASIKNPDKWSPQIKVAVEPNEDRVIIKVEHQEITVPQHINLAPLNKTNEFGTPHTVNPTGNSCTVSSFHSWKQE